MGSEWQVLCVVGLLLGRLGVYSVLGAGGWQFWFPPAAVGAGLVLLAVVDYGCTRFLGGSSGRCRCGLECCRRACQCRLLLLP